MATCPYCSNIVCQRVCQQGLSWFCRHCWIEIPEQVIQAQQASDRPIKDAPPHWLPFPQWHPETKYPSQSKTPTKHPGSQILLIHLAT